MEDSYIDYNQNQKFRLVQYMQWFKTSLTNSPKQIMFLYKPAGSVLTYKPKNY